MMRQLRYIFGLFAMICVAVSCTREEIECPPVYTGNETVLMMNVGLAGLQISAEPQDQPRPSVETRSESNWIQSEIAIANEVIVIFDHDTGKKVFSTSKFPLTVVSTSAPYQSAWVLGNFTPDASKTYDLAYAANFPKTAELKGLLNTASWDDLMDHEPLNRTFQTIRTDMNPSGIAVSEEEAINQPTFDGTRQIYPNQWRAPVLSGTIRGLKLCSTGLNVVGFSKDASDDYVPAVSLPKINKDLGTSYTDLPTLHDAQEDETDNDKRVMTVSPCYSLVVVDRINNNTGGKLEITDIFMMNVPSAHHLFSEETYHFGGSDEMFKNAIGMATYSSGKDLLSGFQPEWFDADFLANTASDDFARLLHYPVTSPVSQSAFRNYYFTGDHTKSNYHYYPAGGAGPMLDRMYVSKSTAADRFDDIRSDYGGSHWAFLRATFGLDFVTATVRRAPFFLVSQNGGDYPNEMTVDENGDRQYLFATRLVIRGKWKDTPTSTPEVVYYPILVNGPNQGFTASYGDDSQEKVANFVQKGRRYIYNITLESKGVRNPWTASRVAVELGDLELKVEVWADSEVEIPKYIY